MARIGTTKLRASSFGGFRAGSRNPPFFSPLSSAGPKSSRLRPQEKAMGVFRFAPCLLCPVLAAATAAGQEDTFPGRVNRAIDHGVKVLKALQAKDGHWETTQRVGLTSLCAWTLLEAGVPKTDPALEKALAFVRRN